LVIVGFAGEIGGSSSPENASPARTDGEGFAEGANIRRQSRVHPANALRTTRSTSVRIAQHKAFPLSPVVSGEAAVSDEVLGLE
jgi:hypothetical protein